MNLFIIPSWYPSENSPLSGIFTKEQAEATAEIKSDVRVMVSLWGHGDTLLPIKKPWRWPSRIKWCFGQKKDQIRNKNGVIEIFNARLNWSDRMPFGGVNQLIAVNRRNFLLAEKNFGKIDIIHAHVSYPAGYIASLLSKEFKVPYVVTEHMSPFPFPNLIHQGVPLSEVSDAFKHAAASIAVSPSLAKRIASFGYEYPAIIPNMVDERKFSLGQPTSPKTVFFTLCGITEQKGIDHLLDAIALWNPSPEKFEFRIGGDGPLREEYEKKAKALGLADRVTWLGHVSRTRAPVLFRDCHIFVLPSRHETFGIVYAEALACGKPIVATRCGGPESIVNQGNGVLVDVGDIDGLSKAMQKVTDNLEVYKPNEIRADFQMRFSRAAVIDKISVIYEQVLSENSKCVE